MKRTIIAAVAALVAASPIAAATASAQNYRGDHDGNYDGRRDNDRNDRRDNDRRDNRRWDQGRDNGFYLNGRFYYGQPNYAQMQRRDFRPGWQQWRRGERLPSFARARYRELDWRREHFRAPPRGYHYVRDDRGQVLLVGIATGVILSILLNN